MSEPKSPSLVGGPRCGELIPGAFAKTWTWHVPDEKRRMIHVYERRSPTDRCLYFKETRPLYTITI